ncbi:NAD binding domain of 6-phosphogluconate dehydrogenase [Pyrenophora tritici-repentis]|nr:NAD binding domain of 6-phosphogluconate dehydrogenase [Pyrenophora tritici-repentis]KAI0610876.1 NAD binding domain of 6-phosphogluconate dehydrogenase [Pyrenophora tritici-repentis]PZD28941.1 MmsB, 3-hydroxyisobutyrate dehydrogenase beta-hydroxyacid dehydrogenase [Pyrenophora tritici-repentis]
MSLPKELRLGWIGLGSMGLAMATNMQNYITQQILPPLKYWNRTLSRGDTLKVNVKVTYLSSPVFGATPLAVSGNLLIAIAGPPTAIDLVSPFLTGVIARSVIRVGPEPSQALLLKTTSNLITAGLMMLLSEAHTLAARTGLPAAVLEDLVAQNFGDYALGVSKRLTGGAYYPPKGEVPTSRLELGIKDVGHGVGIAREQGMRLGIGEMYLEAAEEARKYGEDKGRRCDSSSVFGVVRRRAGLEFATDMVKERDGDAKSEKK